MKEFSSAAIHALKEALTNIYWRKKDLRSFVYHTIKNKAIINTIDWSTNTKNESASILVERMIQRRDIYEDDILKLFYSVMNFNDFSHLKIWDESEIKIRRAKESVNALRLHTKDYFSIKEEKKKAEERKESHEALIEEKLIAKQKLAELKSDFYIISAEKNPQSRGYLFEKFLNELFILFDLDPKKSFKIAGEQIDGSFTFKNQDYLMEAKWTKSLIGASELYSFGGKISGKLKTALGLLISFNGFSNEIKNLDAPIVKSILLMDGRDLMAVLEDRISLGDMLYRKRRHATEKGEIYLPFDKF